MMAQFLAIKARYPDCLLFYRMGDFYELFFDDAVKAAEALDIALTKRGKHLGEDIPMCGVPVHSHESYLARLIRKGFKVAVAEQTEDPAEARKRGAKAVVARDVVRVVTPGTLTEDELLDARAHNYLAAVAEVRGASAVAWLDVSTGAFETQCVAPADLSAVLARLAPGEVLVAEDSDAGADAPRPLAGVLAEWRERTTPLPAARFRPDVSARRLRDVFKVAALDAFGGFSAPEIAAAGALVDYVELTQKGRLPRLSPPRRVPMGAVMEIDGATRRNLELTETLSGERKGSLLSVIDRTVTGAGARLLARRLAAPLTDPQAIARRLDAVQFLLDNAQAREDCRLRLRRCPDVERALARLTVGRGGPRDLAAVRDALAQGPALRALLLQDSLVGEGGAPPALDQAARALGHHETLVDRLTRALAPDLPQNARDGGFIAQGYHPPLDELRGLRDESRRLVAALQARLVQETGVNALKVRHNNVLGYYIEVPAGRAETLMKRPETFIHRQTMAGAVRFTTTELADLEDRIRGAADKALALEQALFADLVGEVEARAEAVAGAARALAAIDVAAALAELAERGRYHRPEVGEGTEFSITRGRHPVVESALESGREGSFVANDCDLGPDNRLWLVTGPNMAGKSTFLRQNALIAVLAQTG